jgi:hypothetical protein
MASNGAYKMIYPSNGYLVKQTVRVFDASTNTFALAGALSLTVTFSSTADGATPIAGLTGLALTELVSFPGVYTRAVAGTLTVALAPWAEQVVYQIVTNPSTNGLRVVTPVLVAPNRLAL